MVPNTAVVTGGTRGIGLAVVTGLARLGTTVVAVGRDAARADAVAAELVAQGLDVVGAACDVADPLAVQELASGLGDLGAPDLLVCSAAVMGGARTVRTEPQEWERVMATNLTGVYAATRAFGAPMLARRSGRIVVLSACLGRMSGPGTNGGLAPYRISKAAVNALVKNLAAEARAVAVDAVCPGHCRTDMGARTHPGRRRRGPTPSCGWPRARTPTRRVCSGRTGSPSPGETARRRCTHTRASSPLARRGAHGPFWPWACTGVRPTVQGQVAYRGARIGDGA